MEILTLVFGVPAVVMTFVAGIILLMFLMAGAFLIADRVAGYESLDWPDVLQLGYRAIAVLLLALVFALLAFAFHPQGLRAWL